MTPDEIESLEQARCAAMLAADVAALDALMADALVWAHASGKLDTKASMVAGFRDGSTRVFALERSDPSARVFGSAAIVTGTVRMDAMMGGVRKQFASRYAGVWSSHAGAPQLVNWQSAPHG